MKIRVKVASLDVLSDRLNEDSENFFWIHDTPPHWLSHVRDYLDDNLPPC